jgi:hypothetical protein
VWGRAADDPIVPEVLHATHERHKALGQGLVSLVLYGHLQPLIGDAADLYGFEVEPLVRALIAPRLERPQA